MKISVCVGSSCHLKGSYAVIAQLKELIAAEGLNDRIELSASFCLGRCATGVTVKVDDDFLDGLNESNVRQVFVDQILPRLRGDEPCNI